MKGCKTMRKKNLKIQLNQSLDGKLAIGTSRHKAKQENGGQSDKIHSIGTADNYRKSINNFGNWLRDNKPEIWATKDLSSVDKSVANEYLQYQRDRGLKSASISRDLAAINKVLNLDLSKKDAGIEKRSIYDIKRSRNETNSRLTDSMRESNREQILMAQATGCRRASMTKLEKEHFIIDKQSGLPVGVYLTEKGGKERVAPILREYQQAVGEILDSKAPGCPLFDSYSSRIDNHSFRAEYAEKRYQEITEQYELMGREIKEDYRGYDPDILREVSQNLGHNRLDVVEEHYINKRNK